MFPSFFFLLTVKVKIDFSISKQFDLVLEDNCLKGETIAYVEEKAMTNWGFPISVVAPLVGATISESDFILCEPRKDFSGILGQDARMARQDDRIASQDNEIVILRKDIVMLKEENVSLRKDLSSQNETIARQGETIARQDGEVVMLKEENVLIKERIARFDSSRVSSKVVLFIQDVNAMFSLEKTNLSSYSYPLQTLREFRNQESHYIYIGEIETNPKVRVKLEIGLRYLRLNQQSVIQKLRKILRTKRDSQAPNSWQMSNETVLKLATNMIKELIMFLERKLNQLPESLCSSENDESKEDAELFWEFD